MEGDMHLLLVGVNHRTAGIDEREALAFTRDERLAALAALAAECAEAIVVTTCNRTEFYVVHRDVAEADRAVRDAVRGLRGHDLLAPGPHRYAESDADAARHLFRVAAGLDSMVLGDLQILGQVKEAVALAREAGTAGPLLDRLFDRALRAGKRARAETSVSGGVVSVASASVELLRAELTTLADRRVLVVGAGETARLVVRHLAQTKSSSVIVANRTLESGRTLAAAVGGRAVPLEEVAGALAEADGVICATRAPGFVLTAARLAGAMAERGGRPLVLVDLAVPRDVEPAAAAIAGVTLHAIDAIQRVVDGTLSRRMAEVPRVEALVDDELAQFESWRRSRAVTPLLRELRDHFEQVRIEEMSRLLRHASADERARAERLTQALVNRLLHAPTVTLKDADPASSAGQSRLLAARDLFALGRGRSGRSHLHDA
jgi:glutamyl-tRNA reductase